MEITDKVLNFETQFLIYILLIVVMTFINAAAIIKHKTKRYPVIAFYLLINIFIYLLISYNFHRLIFRKPSVIFTSIPMNGYLVGGTPLEIIFDTPVDMRKIRTFISPDILSKWQKVTYSTLFPFGRKLIFTPLQTLNNDTEFLIYLSNITRPFSDKFGGETELKYLSEPYPQITGIKPENNASGVPISSGIEIDFAHFDPSRINLEVDIQPRQFFTLTALPDSLKIKFQDHLQQGTDYHVDVYETLLEKNIATGEILSSGGRRLAGSYRFTTVKAPLVSAFIPNGNLVSLNSPVEISFDEPMNPESFTTGMEIDPPVSGTTSWSSDYKKLFLNHQGLSKNTKYTVTLPSGIKSQSGGFLKESLKFEFHTAGPVKITDSFPQNNGLDVPVSASFWFVPDQPVLQSSVEENFNITPAVKGRFSVCDTKIEFFPDRELKYNTGYSVQISKGLTGLNGLPSEEDFTYTFTTQPEEYVLNVPLYKQGESFTCNIASLRMLLSYRGINKTEAQLKQEVGSNGTRGNGNPHLGYTSNFGTYWEPIIAVLSRYRPYRFFENWTVRDITSEINKGNPVMIWGQNGWSDPHDISWTNPDGTRIYAINGMHSPVVIGFRGSSGNPTHIIINDPWRGYSTLPVAEFERRWSFYKNALIAD